MDKPYKAWFIGGPKDCEYIETAGCPWIEAPKVSPRKAAYNSATYEAHVIPQMERYEIATYKRKTWRTLEADHNFYVAEGVNLDGEKSIVEALLLYQNNPYSLETDGLKMAKELPRELWPDKRRPVRRLAAFRRLFVHRLLQAAYSHGML